ncbi:hypothetical protein HMPREF0682_0635, partial [Propionibacterium acidifaciens F0233]
MRSEDRLSRLRRKLWTTPAVRSDGPDADRPSPGWPRLRTIMSEQSSDGTSPGTGPNAPGP